MSVCQGLQLSEIDEFERYMREPEIPLVAERRVLDGSAKKYTNPLLWWKQREAQYPVMARLARRYLAIPATSVPSESLFSTAGRLVSKLRARLGDRALEGCLIIAHNWDLVMGEFDPVNPTVRSSLLASFVPRHPSPNTIASLSADRNELH